MYLCKNRIFKQDTETMVYVVVVQRRMRLKSKYVADQNLNAKSGTTNLVGGGVRAILMLLIAVRWSRAHNRLTLPTLSKQVNHLRYMLSACANVDSSVYRLLVAGSAAAEINVSCRLLPVCRARISQSAEQLLLIVRKARVDFFRRANRV